MSAIKNVQQYLNKTNTDIASLIAISGIIMSTFIEYAWVVSMLACLFMKEEEE